ncbi:MAG: hypothetical protein WCK17_16015 [Verrucomicrobiota bacterium]
METQTSPRWVASKAEPSKAQIALVRQILRRVSDAAPELWVSIAKLKVSQFHPTRHRDGHRALTRLADCGCRNGEDYRSGTEVPEVEPTA